MLAQPIYGLFQNRLATRVTSGYKTKNLIHDPGSAQRTTISMSNRQPNPTIRAPPMPHPGSRNNDSHRSSTTLASYHSATDSASTHVPEDAQTVSTKTSCNEDRNLSHLFSHPIFHSYLLAAGPTTTSISSPSPMPASDAHLRSQNSDLRPSPTTTVSASASTPFDVDRKPFRLFIIPYPTIISSLQSKEARPARKNRTKA